MRDASPRDDSAVASSSNQDIAATANSQPNTISPQPALGTALKDTADVARAREDTAAEGERLGTENEVVDNSSRGNERTGAAQENGAVSASTPRTTSGSPAKEELNSSRKESGVGGERATGERTASSEESEQAQARVLAESLATVKLDPVESPNPAVLPQSTTNDVLAPLDTTVVPPTSSGTKENVESPSAEEEWFLKTITWPPFPPTPSGEPTAHMTTRIIMQNLNGPCSLIALCNVLILRSDIIITPPSRCSVSYTYLSTLVADYLVRLLATTAEPSISLASALEILPRTKNGIDLNPRFGAIDGFKESGSALGAGGELSLFSLSRVPLVHGWIVDPQEEAWDVLVGSAEGDYDKAVERVLEGEEISGGGGGNEIEQSEEDMIKEVERRSLWTKDQEKKVRDAFVIRQFLSSTQTQLTYHGLLVLSNQLPPSSLSALFRNSHLSVLYRAPSVLGSTAPTLFTLVTDSSFIGEPRLVWESIQDVDGSSSEFYDGDFKRAVSGDDWVRRGGDRPNAVEEGNYDLVLAQQLQQDEEDAFHRREAAREERPPPNQRPPPSTRPAPPRPLPNTEQERARKLKQKKDKCVIS